MNNSTRDPGVEYREGIFAVMALLHGLVLCSCDGLLPRMYCRSRSTRMIRRRRIETVLNSVPGNVKLNAAAKPDSKDVRLNEAQISR